MIGACDMSTEGLDAVVPLVAAEHTTFRVSDYVGWKRDSTLQLRPKFQRGSIWNEADKSLLIDSVLRGFPVPLVILQEEYSDPTAPPARRVVDGQQRLRTLISFVNPNLIEDLEPVDEFTYRTTGMTRRHPGYKYEELSEAQQRKILNTRISAVILDSETGEAAVLEVYDRLNRTGVKLSGQELRYAKMPGAFSELAYQLARQNQRRWTTWKVLATKDISQMGDIELTSDLLLLILDGVQKTGKRELDSAYSSRPLTEEQANFAGRVYQTCMDSMDELYNSIQSPDPIRPFRSKAWLYSIFSLYLQLGGVIDESGEPLINEISESVEIPEFKPRRITYDEFLAILSEYQSTRTKDVELAKAVSGAASDRKSRMSRLKFLRSALG